LYIGALSFGRSLFIRSVEVVNALSWSTSGSSSWHSTWWHSAAWHSSWHAASWHSSHAWHTLTACLLVYAHHDWIELGFKLFLFALDSISISTIVALEPLKTFLGSLLNSSFLLIGEDILELFLLQSVLHLEAVVLECVLSLDLLLDELILSLVLLGIIDHSLDFFLGESTLIVGNGDLLSLSGSLILSLHIEDTVGIDIEGDLNLWNTSWSWWDTF